MGLEARDAYLFEAEVKKALMCCPAAATTVVQPLATYRA